MCVSLQDEDDIGHVMSGEDERKSTADKAMKSVDLVKLEKNIKEQLKTEKIDDGQRSPSRFARCELYAAFCQAMVDTL